MPTFMRKTSCYETRAVQGTCFITWGKPGPAISGPYSSSTRDPLRLPGAAVIHGVEGEFDPAENPQLVENVE